MKSIKRILAILSCLFLVSLYLITLVFAVLDNPSTMLFFKASIFSSILIPILIYIYTFIFKLLKKYYGKDEQE